VPGRIWTRRFFLLWLVGFFSYASVYLLMPVLPLYLQQYGATTTAIGTVIGLMSMAALLSRPFVGWLSDGYGRRPLIIIGLVALFASTVGLPFVTGVILFAMLRILAGIGWGSLTATANTLAGEMSPPYRRGEAIGLYTMAGSTALALGPLMGLYLARSRGYETAFWVATGLAGLALGCSLSLETRERKPLAPMNLGTLIFWPARGPAVVLLLHSMTYGSLVIFLPLLARDRNLGNPGLFFTFYALALVVLRGIAGRLSDRFGRAAIIGPGLACGAISMLVLAAAVVQWQMLAAALFFSVGMAFVQPPSLAWALDLAGGRRGTAMATMVAAQDMGIALGGSVLGLVGARSGFGALFIAAAGLSLVGAAGLLVVRMSKRSPPWEEPLSGR